MEFRLYYRGPLHANGKPGEKQAIRYRLHEQLRVLWDQEPLRSHKVITDGIPTFAKFIPQRQVGGFRCVPLVSEEVGLVAEIDILFLRPQRPGAITASGGDIDNRVKTLVDALRVPSSNQLPPEGPASADENLLYCLLDDDALITRLAVTTDQLLEPAQRSEAVLIIHVNLKRTGPNRFWSFP